MPNVVDVSAHQFRERRLIADIANIELTVKLSANRYVYILQLSRLTIYPDKLIAQYGKEGYNMVELEYRQKPSTLLLRHFSLKD